MWDVIVIFSSLFIFFNCWYFIKYVISCNLICGLDSNYSSFRLETWSLGVDFPTLIKWTLHGMCGDYTTDFGSIR